MASQRPLYHFHIALHPFRQATTAPARLPPIPMTIRLRLTLWYTALLGTTLILFSFIFYSTLAANLWLQTQQDTARQANDLAALVELQLQGGFVVLRQGSLRIEFPELDLFAGNMAAQLIDLNGMILKRSSNMGSMTVTNYSQALPTIRTGRSHRLNTTSDSGMAVLVYSTPITYDRTIVGALQLIKPVGSVHNTLGQVSRYLIFGTAFSLILAAIVGAFLARRALAPIDTITKTASEISRTRDLGRRLTIHSDANEIGRLAATFNEMLDRIQALFKTQERLVADVSHELRTPLTTIQGNFDLLRRYVAAAEHDPTRAQLMRAAMQEALNEAEAESIRMNTLINDLLVLAQVDSGALQLHQGPVEMDTLLLEVYRQTRRLAQQRHPTNPPEIHLGSEDQALVWGDPERLRQILLNLTDNAVKYTPPGGTITLGLERRDGWVSVSVTDTGIGISAEDQTLIFDRFYRTDKARTRERGGSGLGLSIAQRLAAAHGGQISVQSELRRGSTFVLTLPAYTPERIPEAVAQPTPDTALYTSKPAAG